MSVLDLLKQPLYALIAAGGLAAAGGGAYYVLVPAQQAPQAAAPADTPSAPTPVTATDTRVAIPNSIQIELEVRAETETRNTQFKCDFTLRQDQACIVPFASALLKRNAGNPTLAHINVPGYMNPIVKEGISWKDLTEGTSFKVSGKEYTIKAKASAG